MTALELILDNLSTIAESKKIYDEAFSELDDRTRSILTMRFGLDGKKSRTLDQCGNKHFISRERIRQIESKGLQQLRAKIKFKARMKTL